MANNQKLIAKIEAEEPTKRLAVLIDADNAQASVIDGLLAEIARFGEATVKRIYGDFTSPASAQWKKVLNKFAIKPIQQFAYTKGKNATDITLVIDAMDLLYTRRFEGFCLVSSDSDFTDLAVRIREEGLTVYGFGEKKTPEAFRNACHQFLFTEILRPVLSQGSEDTSAHNERTGLKEDETPIRSDVKNESLVPDDFPSEFFKQALGKISDDKGWADLGHFGNYLKQLRSDFDSRNYGYNKLSALVKAHPEIFEAEERRLPNSEMKVLYIRAK